MIVFFETGGKLLTDTREKSLYPSSHEEINAETRNTALKGQYYEIRIKGQLSGIWADWFEGMTIEYLADGEMLLAGTIADQSALMGILNKLARLNLTLISVNEIKKS